MRQLWSASGYRSSAWLPVRWALVGAIVVLSVSSCGGCAGRPSTPDIVGLTTEEARDVLEAEGLVLGNVTLEPSDTEPVDTVMSQDPAVGDVVDEGSAVDVIAARAPDPEGPPTVIGMSRVEAEAELESLGMVPIAYEMYSSEQQTGRVVDQVPGPDENWLLKGRQVLIYVSLGPRAGDVVVPSVTDVPTDDAQKQLIDLGLVPQVFYYENQAETEGMIVGQLPDPQTVVPSGSDVAIIEVARSAAEDQEIAPEP